MIKELINLATHLDQKGRIKEADYLDFIIKAATDELSDGEKIKILTDGLLELREDATSGGAEMAIIDEALRQATEETPWLAPDHGRPRGMRNVLNDDEAEKLISDYVRSDGSARHIEDAWPPIE